MHTWTRAMYVATALTTACASSIEDPGRGQNPDGSPSSGAPGSNGGPINPGTTDPGSSPGPTTGSPGSGQPGGGISCTPGIPRTSHVTRLTRVQYDNTVRDLTGLTLQASSMLAPDSTGSVDERTWTGYQAAAEAVAAQVAQNAAARARVVPCTPSGDGSACARQLIEQFGMRAFRRPLTTEEVERYLTLYTGRAELTPTGTFDEAVQLIVEAFLVSPSFITKAEVTPVAPVGDRVPLSNYEVASRLSYMLWSSMPDQALFDAAAQGALSTKEQVFAQAQRMLQDPKARAMVNKFHEHYVHMGEGTRWADIERDPMVYPAFRPAMGPLMNEETKRFFEYVVFEKGGSFRDLITSPVAFVNATLAPLYGLNASQFGTDLVRVDLDPTTRSGLFTRLGFLASHSLYNRTSPILRGAFIQKEVLCNPIGAPPPDAESTPLPTEGLPTNRERTDAQTASAACAGCHHGYINPTGFAFESYDATGAIQTMENGAVINSAALVPVGSTTVEVKGAVDLMQAIARSPEAQRCYAKKWVQYAFERVITDEDACTVESLTTKLSQDGYTVLNLISDLTLSDSFRFRTIPEVTP